MWHRLASLIVKDFQQLVRDRLLLVFLLVGPTVQLVMMGHATSEETKHLPTAIIDEDRTSDSRAVAVALDNLQELDVTHHLDSVEEASSMLDRGEISVAVFLPSGFSAALASPAERPVVQLLVDGSNVIAVYTALGAAEGAIGTVGREIAVGRLLSQAPATPSGPFLSLQPTARFNPELTHSFQMMPSELSLIALIVTLLVSSVGIVRERETGTLEQLMVTPLRRIELIVAKATLPTLVTIVDFLAMLAITVWVFGVPIRGSIPLLLAVTLVFVLAQLTWGLVISTVSATQQQAVLLVFMTAILSVAFSGYLVAVENMPTAMRWISHVFPISHYLSMLRAIMLKGATVAHIRPQLVTLMVLGAASLAVSVRSFRKQLE